MREGADVSGGKRSGYPAGRAAAAAPRPPGRADGIRPAARPGPPGRRTRSTGTSRTASGGGTGCSGSPRDFGMPAQISARACSDRYKVSRTPHREQAVEHVPSLHVVNTILTDDPVQVGVVLSHPDHLPAAWALSSTERHPGRLILLWQDQYMAGDDTRTVYSLLVGIDAYPAPVPALHGCVNDVVSDRRSAASAGRRPGSPPRAGDPDRPAGDPAGGDRRVPRPPGPRRAPGTSSSSTTADTDPRRTPRPSSGASSRTCAARILDWGLDLRLLPTDRLDALVLGLPSTVKIACVLTCRIPGMVVLLCRDDRAKVVALLVLRHQNLLR